MTIPKQAIKIIKKWEGLRLDAYKCSAGVWTIGYGTTAAAGVGIDPQQGMAISEYEAELYLEKALVKFAAHVDPNITAPINDNERSAFLSLAYNIGPYGFAGSSALRHFNAGDKDLAAAAILLWNKAQGKTIQGLVNRRADEQALFLTPVTQDTAPTPTKRKSAAQSTTVQASAVAVASGAGSAVTAISSLDSTAQYIVLAFAGLIILAGLWIMKERLRKWAEGDK